MKKWLKYIIPLLTLVLLTVLFWDPIIDFLPIDQSGWRLKDGGYFYLDEDGDRLTGWQDLNGKRYYLDPATGIMHTGWLEAEDGIYCLAGDGNLRTGWYTRNGKPCYLHSDGKLATGWLELDDRRYYMNADGAPNVGFFETDGARYYADDSGIVQTGWQDIRGSQYYFADDGTMCTGWLDTEAGLFYFSGTGAMHTGWLDTENGRSYLSDTGMVFDGWVETGDGRYYLDENGLMYRGWLEYENELFYLDEDGTMYTGWLEYEGQKYYLTEDGSAARGKYAIDGLTYFFTSTGANLLMVNRWNPVPEGYSTGLITLPNTVKVSDVCYDSLMAMTNACRAAGFNPNIIDGNRSRSTQSKMFNDRLNSYLAQGYDYGTAYGMTRAGVADPGTSEHELGLAVDIIDHYYPSSDIHAYHSLYWLSEHCWEYGWILRYPAEKSSITGIMYEPWHFRYVGVELAMELKDSGLCLEEYLDALTGDASTCGNPDA